VHGLRPEPLPLHPVHREHQLPRHLSEGADEVGGLSNTVRHTVRPFVSADRLDDLGETRVETLVLGERQVELAVLLDPLDREDRAPRLETDQAKL